MKATRPRPRHNSFFFFMTNCRICSVPIEIESGYNLCDDCIETVTNFIEERIILKEQKAYFFKCSFDGFEISLDDYSDCPDIENEFYFDKENDMMVGEDDEDVLEYVIQRIKIE